MLPYHQGPCQAGNRLNRPCRNRCGPGCPARLRLHHRKESGPGPVTAVPQSVWHLSYCPGITRLPAAPARLAGLRDLPPQCQVDHKYPAVTHAEPPTPAAGPGPGPGARAPGAAAVSSRSVSEPGAY
eukprot:170399-Hanusia_phi.AAC.1